MLTIEWKGESTYECTQDLRKALEEQNGISHLTMVSYYLDTIHCAYK